MYRNVYYDNRHKEIILWTWNEQGDRITRRIPYKPYLYIEKLGAKDATSIYNTPLQRMDFKNQIERKTFVKNVGISRLFYNIDCDHQFLLDEYNCLNESPDFNKYALRIFYLDIETYSPAEFPHPEYAKDQINLITIYDSLNDKYHTWGLNKQFKTTKSNSIYYNCSTEKELLTKFIKFWENNYPDVISGWNINGFDIPYLITRITNVLGEDYALSLSPVNRMFKQENVNKNIGGKKGIRWRIYGLTCLDYMDVYITFNREKRASYSLNYISDIELGDSKIKFNATSLTQLADTDWQKFVEYNIKDVELVTKLEDKLQYLKMCRALAYTGLAPLEAALGTITVVTGAIALEAKKENKIIPTMPGKDVAPYEGGYVMDPLRGLKEGVIIYDANSLYPNTIITCNISPETKIGKIIEIDKEKDIVRLELINKKEYLCTQAKLAEIIKEKKLAISKSRVLFSQLEKGLCPKIIDRLYARRVSDKQKIKSLNKQNLKLDENSDEYKTNEIEINRLDINQHIIKIFLNRIYGSFANKFSPLFDVDIASSITKTGQSVIKAAGKISQKFAIEKYGINESLLNYVDTDSVHLCIAPIINKLEIPFEINKKINPKVYEIADELEKYINTKISEWGENKLNSIDPRFVFKRESMCDISLYIEKKRYILHVMDAEGIPVDKLKFTGVQYNSTSTPKKIKEMTKKIVDTIFREKKKDSVDQIYFESYDKFHKLNIADLAKTTGIKNLDKFDDKSNSLTNFKKGTPAHVRAALIYNRLLDINNLSNKYEKITSGNKIKWFYTKTNNKYNITKVAYIDEFPPELNIEIDKEKMFETLLLKEINRFYTAIGWVLKHPKSKTEVDIFDMFGAN